MGYTPNQQRILVGVWIPTIISGIILVLRLYCKHIRHRGLWWDDAAVTAAWVLLLVSTILESIEIPLGFGLHVYQLSVDNLDILGPLNVAIGTLVILAASWSKLAFAATLYRITTGWTRLFVVAIAVSINLTMSSSLILNWAQCTPPQKLWKPEVAGHCLPVDVRTDYNVFAGVYAGIMDIVLALLPWTILPKLQIKFKEKVGIGLAMSLGIL
ncbi:unnamed protein product [Discula destructiva]